jgi:hypothetical protein
MNEQEGEMKTFIALFLAFSILVISGDIFAKERKGDDVIIQKTDGTQVTGELIAVKENAFLLMDRDSGVDVTVEIEEVSVVRIVKKSKLLLGTGAGLATGLIMGAAISHFGGPGSGSLCPDENAIAAMGATVGLTILGAVIGSGAGKDETIQIVEGMPDSTIKAILAELSKKARVKNAK